MGEAVGVDAVLGDRQPGGCPGSEAMTVRVAEVRRGRGDLGELRRELAEARGAGCAARSSPKEAASQKQVVPPLPRRTS